MIRSCFLQKLLFRTQEVSVQNSLLSFCRQIHCTSLLEDSISEELKARVSQDLSKAEERFYTKQIYSKRQDAQPGVAFIRSQFPLVIANTPLSVARRDIRSLLDDIVEESQIRAEYNDRLEPVAWWVNLPSRKVQLEALDRAMSGPGARLGLMKMYVTASEPDNMRRAIYCPMAMGSRGRYVLITNMQHNATPDDVLRFCQGYELMDTAITLLKNHVDETGASAGRHRAVARFVSTSEAHRFVRKKNGGVLLNSPVKCSVLQ